MGVQVEIKNIQELLSSLCTEGKELLSYEHEALLPPGENYGSTMLKLKVNLKSEDGEETVNCVAKLVPPTPYLWKMFNIPVTFKKEVGMYMVIGPTLNKFGLEHGIKELLPILPDYIGARFSLNSECDEIDEDAALILKNMTVDGYTIGDRFTGYDRGTIILLLKDLAILHASVIAYKLTKPDDFKKYILSLIEAKMPVDLAEETIGKLGNRLKDGLMKNDKCIPLIPKVLNALSSLADLMILKPREPFATLVHNDFWMNNIMVQYINGKPVATKFLDFQIMEYDNPANDVLFLMYSSAKLDLLNEVDEFLNIYFDQFIRVLKQLNCDTTQFSQKAFLDEVKAAAIKELVHILFMLRPLFTKKGEVKELSEMNNDDALILSEGTLHDNYYPRLHFVVQDFATRGWV